MHFSIFKLLPVLLCPVLSLRSQPVLHPVFSQLQPDLFTAVHYPAAVTGFDRATAGFSSRQLYGLNELSAVSLLGLQPAGNGYFTGLLQTGVFSPFREQEFALGYGRSFGSVVTAGLRFRYTRLASAGYGRAAVLAADIGFLFKPGPQLVIFSAISRAGSTRFGKTDNERLPASWETGMGYTVSAQLYTGIRFVKPEEQPALVAVNMQYVPVSRVVFFGGWESRPAQLTAGAGIWLKKFRTDIFFQFHPQLGITPCLRLVTAPNKKQA